MVLTEKDLEKFNRKIIFDCQYGSNKARNITMFGFNKYFDLGEGIINEKMLKSKEHKSICTCTFISSVFKCERDRLVFMREIYSDALENAYPIFLRFDEDYFFLNELKFNKPEREEEGKKVNEKEKELTLLMEKHLHEDVIPLSLTLKHTLK